MSTDTWSRTTPLRGTGVLEATEKVIERCRSSQRVFTTLLATDALEAARLSQERLRRGAQLGPLDGVPIAVKDVFDLAGTVTTNGSAAGVTGGPAVEDAALVLGLRDRGLVVVGKTNMSELAFTGLGLNPHHGTPANPRSHDVPLVPGGSSSGSAVAVATGLVPLAIGTDTSGSVRVPAAFCGVVGYKATPGRFPVAGMCALSPDLDSVGVLGVDAAAVRSLVRSLSPGPSAGAPGTVRLVVPDDDLVGDCDPAVRTWFDAEVRLLAGLGFIVEHRALPVLGEAQRLMDEHGTLVAADAWSRYGHLLTGPAGRRLDPAVRRRLRAAAAVGEAAVVRGEMARLRSRLVEQLGSAFLVCPTVRHLPPAIAAVEASATAFDAINTRTLRSTMLLSYLGMPGVSLPLQDGRHRGIGFLVSAAAGHDLPVLDTAVAIQRALAEVEQPYGDSTVTT